MNTETSWAFIRPLLILTDPASVLQECFTCVCVGVRVDASRRRRLTDGLTEAYQLICLEQHSSHLYLSVQLAAIHTHNSFLWIRCQASASCSQLFDHFLYLYVSCTPARLPTAGISLVSASSRAVLNTSPSFPGRHCKDTGCKSR